MKKTTTPSKKISELILVSPKTMIFGAQDWTLSLFQNPVKKNQTTAKHQQKRKVRHTY